MNLSRHHILAVAGGALMSAIALSDAVIHGLTGNNSVFADDSGHPGWILAGGVVHGIAYAALLWVLVREKGRFLSANRFARILWYPLAASFALLAVGFLLLGPIVQLGQVALDGPIGTVWGLTAIVGFAGMIGSSLLLGVALLRRNPLGLGGRLLCALLPMLLITIGLSVVATNWAHPGYLETIISFGCALLGVGVTATGITGGTPRAVLQTSAQAESTV